MHDLGFTACHHSSLLSCSSTNLVLVQLDSFRYWQKPRPTRTRSISCRDWLLMNLTMTVAYQNVVYLLSKGLDASVEIESLYLLMYTHQPDNHEVGRLHPQRFVRQCRTLRRHGHRDVRCLPKELDEKVAKLQINAPTMFTCMPGCHRCHLRLNEGLEGVKVVNFKPQVDRFVFPDCHGVIVLVSSRRLKLSCAIGHHSFVVLGSGACRKNSMRKWRNCTLLYSVRSYRRFEERAAFRARRATVLRDRGLLPESSRTRGARRLTVLRDRGLLPESSRTRGARWATVLRHRGLLPPRSSKWKSRAQVAEICLEVRRVVCVTNAPVPQGTTALTTPPFVRAGYDCRNNTTVL